MLNLLLALAASVQIPCSGDIAPDLQYYLDDCYAGGDCMIEIGAGSCTMSEVVELCPTVEIEGASDQHTTITVPPGNGGFHIIPYVQCRNESKPWVGKVRLAKFRLNGSRTSSVSYGVHAENGFRLKQLHVTGFTQAVRATADVHNTPAGNANVSRMEEIFIYWTDHAAVYLEGGDVNVIVMDQVNVGSTACEKADDFPQLGECAGIVDKSFLGNTYIASHVAGSRTTEGVHKRSYLFSNPNARHAIVGAYAEADQLPGYLSPTSLVVGGIADWEGPGTWIQGNASNGFRVINKLDPNNVVQLELGEASNMGGTYWAARSGNIANGAWPLRLKAHPATGQYFLDVANFGVGHPVLRIVGDHSQTSPLGTFRLKSSLFEVQ